MYYTHMHMPRVEHLYTFGNIYTMDECHWYVHEYVTAACCLERQLVNGIVLLSILLDYVCGTYVMFMNAIISTLYYCYTLYWFQKILFICYFYRMLVFKCLNVATKF